VIAGIGLRPYEERLLVPSPDPLPLVAALAGSGRFGRAVVYELGDTWHLAFGALAEVRVRGDHIEVRSGDRFERRVLAPDLSDLDDALAGLPVEDWHAFGWAAFELTADPDDRDPNAVLLELVVPRTHVLLSPGRTLVRSVDEAELDAVGKLLDDPPGVDESPSGSVELDLGDGGDYRDAVAAAVAVIRSGQLSKAIISRTVPIEERIDFAATLVRGRRANTPARSFLIDCPDFQAVGFSPETIVEVGADRTVATCPLAGTRARLGEADYDRRLREELLSDPKELYEHAVSVKAAFDEMRSVCEAVHVSDFMDVAARGSVQHLASRVTGRLRENRNRWQAFAALFPGITASGIPKPAARRLIRLLERRPRGLYAGAVIKCDAHGRLDAALVLRSLFRRRGRTWLQAGAGIVADSRPEREYEETCEKLRSIAPYLVTER
jgi:salicylate synthase